MTLTVNYSGLPLLPQNKLEFSIEIADPCAKPNSITLTDQPEDPIEYFYTAIGASLNINPLIVDPGQCVITYECVSVDGGHESNVKCV